jgi:Arc/MetJ family transcription regulator
MSEATVDPQPSRPTISSTHAACVDSVCMATNLAIDDQLLDHARSVGGYRTKRETVNEALREFIQRRERLSLLQLAGKIDYDPRYDYKKDRRAR